MSFATRVAVSSGVFAFVAGMPAVSQAQNCGSLNLNGLTTPVQGLQAVGPALSASSALSGAVSAANTAFLTQSTVFVTAPASPKPDSEGAGIWTRAVGGELTLNTNTQVSATLDIHSAGLNGSVTNGTACNTQFHQTFGGFQLGRDMAKLNVAGWNLSLGTTAGFLETNGSINGLNGSFSSTTQAPFVGMYAVATYGNFFTDGLIRADYIQTNLNSPAATIFNQKVDAHGFTAMASAGYNWRAPNSNWFVEPSVGAVWSREKVDSINVASPLFFPDPTLFSGTTQVNGVESVIGRAGLRVGTVLETNGVVYSPFAAVSVWHDFAGQITSNYASCPTCILGVAQLTANTSSSGIGTFGQYSIGVNGQLKNTGWLGFARVDYREGPEMHGVSGTGGIRYQFTPTEVAGAMSAKEPVLSDYPVNWTGWHAGLIGGASEYGRASLMFPGIAKADPSLSPDQIRPSGVIGGGTLGYNYQAGRWVVGVEGDIAGTNTNGSTQCAPLEVGVPLFQTTCHDSMDWIATATARLGYAWTPRSLLYVKAGGAFADEKVSVTCNLGLANGNSFNPNTCLNSAAHFIDQASVSNIRAGWTVGMGSEFALTDRWSIKGEFVWLDFGTKTLTLSDGTAFNSTLHAAQGKVGIDYKFWP
jgi:outer membrane autotransporter protein